MSCSPGPWRSRPMKPGPPGPAGGHRLVTGSGCSGSASSHSRESGLLAGGSGSGEVVDFPKPEPVDDARMRTNRLGTSERPSVWSRIKRIALTDAGALMRGLNAEDLEHLERVLIEADFGVSATVELTQALEDEVGGG